MNTKTNLSQHPCENKCSNFQGEQCKTCLISDLGDDRHLHNHISANCRVYSEDELKHINRANTALGEVS